MIELDLGVWVLLVYNIFLGGLIIREFYLWSRIRKKE